MSTPRFYSWDDDGSPGRALTGNHQNKLKQILVACLVTGYGDKLGAGWTLEHEHANGFALSNGQNFINFVSNLKAKSPYPAMPADMVHIYVAESITSTANAVIAGTNLCSGQYRQGVQEVAGRPRHGLAIGHMLDYYMHELQWTIVADDRTAVFCCSASAASATGNYYQTTLYFGDTVNDIGLVNTFTVLGGANLDYDGINYNDSSLCGGFTAPRNLLTGLAKYAETHAQPFLYRQGNYPFENTAGPIPAHLSLQSPRIAVGTGYAGRLRGVGYDDVLGVSGWPVYLRALGFSGSDFADRGKVVTIGSHKYAHAVGFNGGFIMTSDPAFW